MRRLIVAFSVTFLLSACALPTAPASHPRASVDRSILTLDKVNGLDPNDLDSIVVLKGAAASAVYGTHGCTAIFVVTTKRTTPSREH
jgi:hypothetical protein